MESSVTDPAFLYGQPVRRVLVADTCFFDANDLCSRQLSAIHPPIVELTVLRAAQGAGIESGCQKDRVLGAGYTR